VPLDGTTTFAALAETTGIAASALTRILHYAIAHRIFCEPAPGLVAHSAASKLLVQDARIEAWFHGNVQEM
jgi:hypothetical protein